MCQLQVDHPVKLPDVMLWGSQNVSMKLLNNGVHIPAVGQVIGSVGRDKGVGCERSTLSMGSSRTRSW